MVGCKKCCMGEIDHSRESVLDRMDRVLPLVPTSLRPGSDAKVDLLVWRYENGFELWHPRDLEIPRRSLDLIFEALREEVDPGYIPIEMDEEDEID